MVCILHSLSITTSAIALTVSMSCWAMQGPDATFVRVLLLRNRMMGAVLIGNTDYEEVFENLILDGLDLSEYGPDLLSPDTNLDAVFD